MVGVGWWWDGWEFGVGIKVAGWLLLRGGVGGDIVGDGGVLGVGWEVGLGGGGGDGVVTIGGVVKGLLLVGCCCWVVGGVVLVDRWTSQILAWAPPL